MSRTALIVVDMMNDYHHDDAEALARSVSDVVAPLVDLVERAARRSDVDVVYVNDNHGDFAATREAIVRRALHGAHPELVEPVVPDASWPFLEKVRHSAFYATPLGYLLNRLDTRRVVLTGQVTEQCILYSALDAYVRHFEVTVAADAVAHIDAHLGDAALQMMERNMRAAVLPAHACLDYT